MPWSRSADNDGDQHAHGRHVHYRLRAVAGEPSILRPKINSAEATTYAS
jgi:hypothetical protein